MFLRYQKPEEGYGFLCRPPNQYSQMIRDARKEKGVVNAANNAIRAMSAHSGSVTQLSINKPNPISNATLKAYVIYMAPK